MGSSRTRPMRVPWKTSIRSGCGLHCLNPVAMQCSFQLLFTLTWVAIVFVLGVVCVVVRMVAIVCSSCGLRWTS